MNITKIDKNFFIFFSPIKSQVVFTNLLYFFVNRDNPKVIYRGYTLLIVVQRRMVELSREEAERLLTRKTFYAI